MIRLFCLLFFIASLSKIYGQQKKISVTWLQVETNTVNNYEELPGAEGHNYSFNNAEELIFHQTWSVANGDYAGANVSNIIYEEITLKLANSVAANIPKAFSYKIEAKKARGIPYNILQFTPIIKEGNTFKRVLSFQLSAVSSRTSAQLSASKSQKSVAVINSILADGEWFKFRIDTTGVYKITPSFLSSLGMDLNGVDANTIKIYGRGGQHLPYLNSATTSFDMEENPIKIIGAEDDRFSGDDYLLFYGQGPKKYLFDDRSHVNPYTDDAVYYVTAGGNSSKKIGVYAEPVAASVENISTYNHYTFYEEDNFNIAGQGRQWFADKFDNLNTQESYVFTIPALADNTIININTVLGAVFGAAPNFQITVLGNGNSISSVTENFTGIGSNSVYSSRTNRQSLTALAGFTGGTLNISLDYLSGADISSEGFLDYLSIEAICKLQGRNEQFGFVTNASPLNPAQLTVSNAQNILAVWDVTDPGLITEITHDQNSQLSFKLDTATQRSLVVLDENDFLNPERLSSSRVSNQNLKGAIFDDATDSKGIDYLILTNDMFMSSASRLANFRRQQDGFNVKVVNIQDIYNEFSGGLQDVVAIRNFVKYVYDNSVATTATDGTIESSLKYLCIIGDASYDLKDRIRNNSNHVPMYFANESSNVPRSYATDDFYTLMDADEGNNVANDLMDLSVGRIVARDASDANTIIDKTIDFYNKDNFGDWRSSLLFIADDVDDASDSDLQEKIIEIASILEETVPRANIERLVMDAFQQTTTSGGDRYEVVKRRLDDYFAQGVGFIDYFGHGGEDGITNEFIFTSESAQGLTNKNRQPIFVTLTCELTHFDNPNRNTAGEFLLWNRVGGSVALISTIRELFLSVATNLNTDIINYFFDENNQSRTIGEITRDLKNNSPSENARIIHCVGDPAIALPLPQPQVTISAVNEVPFAQWQTNATPLRALDQVSISGNVVDGLSGAALPNFNGEVIISLFDKDIERTTLGNDGTSVNGELITIDFTESGSTVFKGRASVNSGAFTMDFLLPKNVQSAIGEGKASFYVTENSSSLERAGGETILIGDLNPEAADDTTPPMIELFLNDETFFNGQIVSASPLLFAKISDDSGINTAGGVGHDIQIIIDGNEANPIILNDFYVTDVDDFTSGIVNYQINNLEPGEHSIEFRASDAFNNSNSSEINFVVASDQAFQLVNVLNYPNPFTSYTEFWFEHTGIADETLEVSVQVMTVTGKIVTTLHSTLSGELNYRAGLTWNARDNFGNKLGKGVYLYKIIAKSTLTNKTATKIEKLVLL